MSVHIHVSLAGRPLRRTLLRHRGPHGHSPVGWAITDDAGNVRFPGSEPVAVRVLPWTSVARAGSGAAVMPPLLRRDGDDLDLTKVPGVSDIALTSAAVAAYDRGLRTFAPYCEAAEPAWPLSVSGSFRGLRTPVVTLIHPDRSPARLPFVEPAAPTSGRPRIRLPLGTLDPAGAPKDSAVLAHELAHALHFSLMPLRVRIAVESRYAAWLASRVVTGRDPTHAAERRTTAFVAWLEAFGLFAERYDRFLTAAHREGSAREQQAAFVEHELARWQHLIDRPDSAVEGSVYATSILRPAIVDSLANAVANYLDSARHGVLDQRAFDTYRLSRGRLRG